MYKFNSQDHIHTLNDKPLMGTSTVVGVLAKPLTWWAAGLAVEKLGWSKAGDWKKLRTDEEKEADKKRRLETCQPVFDVIKGMTTEDYLALLDKAYRAHSEKLDKAADAGTDLHAELEAFVKGRMGKIPVREYDHKITPFIEWTDKNIKRFLWSEAHCYSERLWVGGISDCGAELNDGSYIIIDFKSSKEAYMSQFIQIGGYDIEISENGLISNDGKSSMKLDKPISAYAIVPFGSPRPSPVIMRKVDEIKKGFEAAVVLHKLVNNFEE